MELAEEIIRYYKTPAALMDPEGSSLLERLWDGGQAATGFVILTNQRLFFIKSRGIRERLFGLNFQGFEAADQLDSLCRSHGGFFIPLAELGSAQVTERKQANRIPYSDITIIHSPAREKKIFRLHGLDTASDLVQAIKDSVAAQTNNGRSQAGTLQSELEAAWLAHIKDLAALPAPARCNEILLVWRQIIDAEAHAYARLVLEHQERARILEMEGETIIRALLIGHMARQGWILKAHAQAAAALLDESLIAQLLDIGLPVNTLAIDIDAIFIKALRAIINIGIEKGA